MRTEITTCIFAIECKNAHRTIVYSADELYSVNKMKQIHMYT